MKVCELFPKLTRQNKLFMMRSPEGENVIGCMDGIRISGLKCDYLDWEVVKHPLTEEDIAVHQAKQEKNPAGEE